MDKDSVTVWLALKEHATVTLEVYDNDVPGRTVLMTGQRDTIAVGQYLHFVAVTARAGTSLAPNNVYFYDLSFNFKNAGTKTLMDAAGAWSDSGFGYNPFTLPSFALPPPKIEDVRLIHGSCRKPHGEGTDALPLLDDLIRDTAPNPLLRPHQLLLAGDQIYADDVAHGLLLLLTDAGDALLGWKEELPMSNLLRPLFPATFHAEDAGPQSRGLLIGASYFTTDDKRCHLMSLGEYLCMYLFVWSDVLWPKQLPVEADFTAWNSWTAAQRKDFKERFDDETVMLENFRLPLGLERDRRSVRRALANVPTAMICDDHEITDDWNMTRRFCDGVYGDPLGFRIVQNGLTAYSLCQAWGNTPEQFENDPQNPAGFKLLTQLDAIGKAPYDPATPAKFTAASPAIAKIVGVHDANALAAHPAPYRVFHDPGQYVTVKGRSVNDTSLDYHYAIDATAYKIIVTDTRTWRSFPEPGLDTHPVLIEPSMMSQQLGTITPPRAGSQPLGDRLLIVIFTTNFPPIATIGFAAKHPALIGLYKHDLFESWELPSRGFDQMIVELTKVFPPAPTIQGRMLVLSGDVHFSFASRLGYRAETRLGDPSGASQKAKLVVVQIVSSALHNETEDTRGEQTTGYTYTPKWYTNMVRPGHVPVGCAGWNYAGTADRIVGVGGDLDYEIHDLVTSQPSYDFTELEDWKWRTVPDFRYRLDYLTTVMSGMHVPTPPTLPASHGTNAADRTQALKNFNAGSAFAVDNFWFGRPDCVGYNNIGDISFYLSGADLGVNYKARWPVMNETTSQYAMYQVLLKIDDPATYPDFPELVMLP